MLFFFEKFLKFAAIKVIVAAYVFLFLKLTGVCFLGQESNL